MAMATGVKLAVASVAALVGYLLLGKNAKAEPGGGGGGGGGAVKPPTEETPVDCVYPSAGMTLKQAQSALIGLGYDLAPYGADGSCGAKTKAAISKFQADRKAIGIDIAVTGIVDKKTADELKKAPPPFKSEGSYPLTDSNGVDWKVTNIARNTWNGVVPDPPVPEYNVTLLGSTRGQVEAQIASRAAGIRDRYPSIDFTTLGG